MSALEPRHPPAALAPFVAAGCFGATEVHAAVWLTRAGLGAVGRTPSALDHLAVAVALWAPLHGHVCADLDTIGDRIENETRADRDVVGTSTLEASTIGTSTLTWPDPSAWKKHLASSPLVNHVQSTPKGGADRPVDPTRPLVLDGSRLYLTRQWIDEENVARALRRRFRSQALDIATDVDSWIDVMIEDTPRTAMQRAAVRAVLGHDTTVLLGGPGTGKTFTIAAMLHALVCNHHLDGQTSELRVALAAPTNKAARQIRESIDAALRSPRLDDRQRERLAGSIKVSTTLHGLLGSSPRRPTRFRHDRRNVVPYDVVIVDEVSMVSLSMMAALLDALDPGTKLVLVGDSEQLRSVENGAVLPDIARFATTHKTQASLPVVRLTENWRQKRSDGSTSDIVLLAKAMRTAADGASVVEVLRRVGSNDNSEVRWIELRPDESPTGRRVRELLVDDLSAFAAARRHAEKSEHDEALRALESVRVLCAHRRGDHGVSGWNEVAAAIADVADGRTAVGRPVLNSRNDPRTGLVNGDIGIVSIDDSRRRLVFRDATRPSVTTTPRFLTLEPGMLEDAETCFAMTVHKAQGSQYGTVVAVVPPVGSPLLLRELLYTAVTRAVDRLVIIGSKDAIIAAVERELRRESGLADRLAIDDAT